MDSPDANIHFWQAVWSGVLSVLSIILGWNWTRLVAQVESKVDRSEFDQFREYLQQRDKVSDDRHMENTRRLDRIWERVKE